MSRRRCFLFSSGASLGFILTVFATLSNAGPESGYGDPGYGYGKKVETVKPVYIYRPMPLPSWSAYSPTYGFGQAHGQFQPGVFRPVFHDVYQALKVGFDTNRSPIVFSHMRYVPRLPPPVYGDLGALSQSPIISEDFTTNSTAPPPPVLTTTSDDNSSGGEGGSSSYNSGSSSDYGSDVSQFQYGPYNNNDTGGDTSTSSRPSTSTSRSTTTTTTTTTTRAPTPTTQSAPPPPPPTTMGPTALPDELPYYGLGHELNNDYNYRDVAPSRNRGRGRYGQTGNDDDDQDQTQSSATDSAVDDYVDGNSDNNNNRNNNNANNDNYVSGKRQNEVSVEIEPSNSGSGSAAPADNLVENPGDNDPKNNEVKRPNVKKYLLPENELDDGSSGRAMYGYKGVNRNSYGRRQRPALRLPTSAADDDTSARQQTIYREDFSKDQNVDERKQSNDDEPKSGRTTIISKSISSGPRNAAAADVPAAKILTPNPQVEQQDVPQTTTASSMSPSDAYEDFNHDDAVVDDDDGPVRSYGRRRNRGKKPRANKQTVIDIQASTSTPPALSGRALLPAEDGSNVFEEETYVSPQFENRQRNRVLTPEQQHERDIQKQLQAEFNVPQQIVQPYKGVPQQQAQPVVEETPRPSSSLEDQFGVPPGNNVIVSEQPPELVPSISSLRNRRARGSILQRTAIAL